MVTQQIYSDFLDRCKPAAAPDPWNQFGSPADLWRVPADDRALMAALAVLYSRRALRHAGIATKQSQGLVLSPLFTDIDRLVLPLRVSPEAEPYELVAADGAASGRLAVCAALADCRVREGVTAHKCLFFVFTLQDLAALQAVGLAAVLATGLEQISRRRLRQLHKAFVDREDDPAGALPAPATALPSSSPAAAHATATAADALPGAAPPDGPASATPAGSQLANPARLIIAAWSPSNLARWRPPLLDPVLETLAKISTFMEWDVSDILVWQPEEADLRRIGFRLAHGSRSEVAESVLECAEASARPIGDLEARPTRASGLPVAAKKLRAVLVRSESRSAERRRAWRNYERALHDALVAPLLAAADDARGPAERDRFTNWAVNTRILHPAAELVLAQLEKLIVQGGLRGGEPLPGIAQLLRLQEMQLKIARRY
jgi:hypothetical protein